MEGTFHDAHEVYMRPPQQEWQWVATLANRALADEYMAFRQSLTPWLYEVRPV